MTAGLATACSSQCSLINQALAECDGDACFCPTALTAGSKCSQCLATVNVTQAIDMGSAMQICATEFLTASLSSTSHARPALPTMYALPIMSSTAVGTGSSTASSQANSSTSSSKGLPAGAIGGIVGGFIALLLIASVCIFCLARRPKTRKVRDQSTVDPIYPKEPPPKYIEAGMDANIAAEPEVPSARLRYPDPDADEDNRNPDNSGAIGGRLARNY